MKGIDEECFFSSRENLVENVNIANIIKII